MSITRSQGLRAQRRIPLHALKLVALLSLAISAASFQIACSSSKSEVEPLKELEIVPWYTVSGMFPGSEVPAFVERLPADERMVGNIIAKGGYILNSLADCGSCHSNPSDKTELSGGRLLIDKTGRGLVPNITPDTKTGIGSWSIDQIISAFRDNVRPDESPISEYVHLGYQWMSNQDARAVAAYLLAQPAVENQVEQDELDRDYGIFSSRKKTAGYIPATPDIQPTVGYGRYLVHSVASCGRCHSPGGSENDPDKTLQGSRLLKDLSIIDRLTSIIIKRQDLRVGDEVPLELLSKESRKQFEKDEAGTNEQSDPELEPIVVPPGAPNIRGSEGLLQWSSDDIVRFLTTGKRLSEDKVANNCRWESYRGIGDKDLLAIAAYLKSL